MVNYESAKVAFVNRDKGFGFLDSNNGNDERGVFFHVNGRKCLRFKRGAAAFAESDLDLDDIVQGVEVLILERTEGKDGRDTAAYWIPKVEMSLQLYCVVRRTESKSQPKVDNGKKLFTQAFLTREEVVFVGTEEECEIHRAEGEEIRKIG